MKKLFVSCLVTIVLSLATAIAAGYVFIRGHLEQLPEVLRRGLARAQVELTFEGAEPASSGLSLSLIKPALSGTGIPITMRADRAVLGLQLTAHWPPLKAFVTLQRPVILGQPSKKARPPTKQLIEWPDNLKSVAGPISALTLVLTRFQVGLAEASVPEAGLTRFDTLVVLKHLQWDVGGLEHADIFLDLLVGHWDGKPWLTGAHWKGTSRYEDQTITADEQSLALGPFVAQVTGGFEPQSGKWNANAFIPKQLLAKGSRALNPQAQWLKSISGDLELKLNFQGIGLDSRSINAEGKVAAHALKLNIDHPLARGEMKLSMDSSFVKAQSFSINSALDADLTDVGISRGDSFLKPRGVPFQLQLNAEGKEGQYQITKAEAKLNNLSATLSGKLTASPQLDRELKVDIAASIPPTSLVDWEQFFPKYSKDRAQGSVEGKLAYTGPLSDWHRGQLSASLKLLGAKFPIPADLTEGTGFQIEGPIEAHSETDLVLIQGAFRKLSTNTRVDFKAANVLCGDFLRKPAGSPGQLALNISDDGRQARITTGELSFAAIRASLSGEIEELGIPLAQLRFEILPAKMSDLAALSPGISTFTQYWRKQLLEALRSSSSLSTLAGKVADAETPAHAQGKAEWRSGTWSVTDLSITLPTLIVSSPRVSIDDKLTLSGAIAWSPDVKLLDEHERRQLVASSGKPEVPLLLAGTLSHPELRVDQTTLEARLKSPSPGRLAAHKSGASASARGRRVNGARH